MLKLVVSGEKSIKGLLVGPEVILKVIF